MIAGEEEQSASSGAQLPLRLKERLSERCKCTGAASCDDIVYLWLQVTPAGIAPPDASGKPSALDIEQWLNIIDEAAGAGVSWLVLSLKSGFSTFPGVWTLCQWAQKAHGMGIGLHTHSPHISPEEIEKLRQLDLSRLRILVSHDLIEAMRPLEAHGIRVTAADPGYETHGKPCQMPGRMIYVNAKGVLYTCGLVDGNESYRMGTAFEGTFKSIVQDDSLPHAVPMEAARVPHGCDGCPPLVAKDFAGL